MKHWIIVGFAILFMILHDRLSAAKYWFLGAALPLAGFGSLVYQLLYEKSHFSGQLRIAYVIFFVTTIWVWIAGRFEYKQKELKRMKAKDLAG